MSIKSIDAEGLKRKKDNDEQFILVDCREQEEWDESHIPFAQFIPLSEIQDQYSKLTDKNAQIILQCRSGKRSLKAAEFLQEQGYSDLTNLEGGILGWMSCGFETK